MEGTREGLEAARARGRVGGAKAKLSPAQAKEVRAMYGAGRRPREIMELFGVSRATLYRYIGTEAEHLAEARSRQRRSARNRQTARNLPL